MKLWVYLFNEHIALFVFIHVYIDVDVMLLFLFFSRCVQCFDRADVVVCASMFIHLGRLVRYVSVGRSVGDNGNDVQTNTDYRWTMIYVFVIVQSFSSVPNSFPIWARSSFRRPIVFPLEDLAHSLVFFPVYFFLVFFFGQSLSRPQSTTTSFGILFKCIVMDWRRPSTSSCF